MRRFCAPIVIYDDAMCDECDTSNDGGDILKCIQRKRTYFNQQCQRMPCRRHEVKTELRDLDTAPVPGRTFQNDLSVVLQCPDRTEPAADTASWQAIN